MNIQVNQNLDRKNMSNETEEDSHQSWITKLSDFMEKYHLYLVVPFVIFIVQIIVSNAAYGDYIDDGADLRAFFLGADYTWNHPELAYNQGHYLGLEEQTWPYMYLPFFALLFYPLTQWGIPTFAAIFYGIGVTLFFITILMWDYLFMQKRLNWQNRALFLSLMCMGSHYAWNFLFNQSKLYVIFTITLIVLLDQKEKSEIIIHILFMFLISIMTHLVFWYFFYLMKKSFLDIKNSTRKKSDRDLWSQITKEQWKTIIIRFFGAGILFLLCNILFLIHPVLIENYLSRIFGEYVIDSFNYSERDQNSIFGYLIFNFTSFIVFWSIISTLLFTLTVIICFKKRLNLIDALGWICLGFIIYLPLNEEHYYVFILPSLFLWTAHNIGTIKHIPKNFDVLIAIGTIILLQQYLLTALPYRIILFVIFVSIFVYWNNRLKIKEKK
jgi:hypothetical protein